MEKWIAVPNEKVGNIVFGMDRKNVRALFDNKYDEFNKIPSSNNTTDDFGMCHVFYDENDHCEAVEIFGDVEIELNEKIVYPNNISIIKELVDDLEEDGYGYTSVSKSIGLTLVDDTEVIDSILFGTKNYYCDI